MVQETTAFVASDGTLFATKDKAATYEARFQLGKVVSNTGLLNQIMENPVAVYEALEPLVELIREQNAAQPIDEARYPGGSNAVIS